MTFSEYLNEKHEEEERIQTAAARIRELRKMTGLSQQKFGDLYGIPMRTIQNWEYGVNEVPGYLIGLLERVVREDFGGEEK